MDAPSLTGDILQKIAQAETTSNNIVDDIGSFIDHLPAVDSSLISETERATIQKQCKAFIAASARYGLMLNTAKVTYENMPSRIQNIILEYGSDEDHQGTKARINAEIGKPIKTLQTEFRDAEDNFHIAATELEAAASTLRAELEEKEEKEKLLMGMLFSIAALCSAAAAYYVWNYFPQPTL